MQIRLRWRAEMRKYKMSDSEEDVMLIGLYVISNKKKTPHIKKQKPVDPWCPDLGSYVFIIMWI